MRLFSSALVLLLSYGVAPQATPAAPPATLVAAVQAYLNAKGGGEIPRLRWALVDLNGDKLDDAVVLLEGSEWCGSGGCTFEIFRGVAKGFTRVSGATITSEPIRVLPDTQHGWHTLIVRTREGDMLMRFDGTRYPGNPSMQPPASPAQVKAARTVIDE